MSDKPSLFSELKRRHVDKVALVYAVVSWLLIEIAWVALPAFDAPEWMLPAFVLLVALGFVITVIISWAFEMTPEGLKRTADVTPGEVIPYWSKRKFASVCYWHSCCCLWSAWLPIIAIHRRAAIGKATHR